MPNTKFPPSRSAALVASATEFVGRVRELELDKAPGMAETIDWVSALGALGVTDLVRDDVVRTLSALVKTPDDHETVVAALPPAGPRAETTT